MSRGSSGVWVAPPGMATGANVSTSGGGSAVGQRGSVQQETSQFLTQGNTPLGNGQSVGGPVRRACAASGAQWNVQVVKGKMTGKCLWNACKALSVGLLLMALGTAMATIGKLQTIQGWLGREITCEFHEVVQSLCNLSILPLHHSGQLLLTITNPAS